MIVWAVLVNTPLFGFIGLTNERDGYFYVGVLRNIWFQTLPTYLYFASIVLILISPGGLIRNIIIAALMQFLINHIIWGTVNGVFSGKAARKKVKELEKD